jgi:hypothetical protein
MSKIIDTDGEGTSPVNVVPADVRASVNVVPANVQTSANIASGIQPIHIGAIIRNDKIRKIVWSIYGLFGLVIIATVGGLQATNNLAPEWFMFILGAYAALGPAFSSLAVANIDKEQTQK